MSMAIKVGINGFGRIGRCVLRSAQGNSDIDFVAINDLTAPSTLAHLLHYDSVHGRMDATISFDDDSITVAGKKIRILAERDPARLPWKDLGVEVVIESTGLFTKREAAAKHLEAGAKKVVISAPATDPDCTVVLGVNDDAYDPASHHIISNASCTTNCLAPVAKVLLDNFGIQRGLMTTIHSYTNDQKVLDLPHKDMRRARAANLSMIPTTTGAARAVSLVLPALKGKLDGMAIRVPTPNVSLVDLVLELGKDVDAATVNSALSSAADGPMKGILEFCREPLVSIDFKGNACSSIVDGLSTKVIGNKMLKVLSWYDNEWGYSSRVRDLVLFISKKGI